VKLVAALLPLEAPIELVLSLLELLELALPSALLVFLLLNVGAFRKRLSGRAQSFGPRLTLVGWRRRRFAALIHVPLLVVGAARGTLFIARNERHEQHEPCDSVPHAA
jgi:hypothetical protein